ENVRTELAEVTQRLGAMRAALDEGERDLAQMTQRREGVGRELVKVEADLQEVRRLAAAAGEQMTANVGQVQAEAAEAQRLWQACQEEAAQVRQSWPDLHEQARQAFAEVAGLREDCLSAGELLRECRQQLRVINEDAEDAVE